MALIPSSDQTNVVGQPATALPYYEPFGEALPSEVNLLLSSLSICHHQLHVERLGLAELEAGWSSIPHAHHYFEAAIILAGHGESLSAPRHAVGPGTIMCHPPYWPHAWKTVEEETCRCLCIWFSTHPSLVLQPPPSWPVSLTLVRDFQALLEEAGTAAPAWHERFALRLGHILSTILAQLVYPTPDQAAAFNRTLHYLREIDSYLQQRLAEEITLDEVANHLGLHRRTLTRIVRQATGGSSVMHRLRTMRMRKAAEWLCHTELKLTEIASRVGFPELSYFDRCFHAHYHCTPSTYRRQMRNATVDKNTGNYQPR